MGPDGVVCQPVVMQAQFKPERLRIVRTEGSGSARRCPREKVVPRIYRVYKLVGMNLRRATKMCLPKRTRIPFLPSR